MASRLKTAVPMLTLLYVLSPVDHLPDLLLGLGQIDDVGAIGLALLFVTRVVPRLAPNEVLQEHMSAMGLENDTRGTEFAGEPADVVDARFRVKT